MALQDGSAAYWVAYYGVALLALSPLIMLFILLRNPLRESAWDRMFFLSSVILYLYYAVAVCFAAAILASQLGLIQVVNSLGSNPLLQFIFWLLLFPLAPVLLHMPISKAVGVERHGLSDEGVFRDVGSLAFTMSSVFSLYVFFRLWPAANGLLMWVAVVYSGFLFVSSWLAMVQYGRLTGSLGWLIVGPIACSGVLLVAATTGL